MHVLVDLPPCNSGFGSSYIPIITLLQGGGVPPKACVIDD